MSLRPSAEARPDRGAQIVPRELEGFQYRWVDARYKLHRCIQHNDGHVLAPGCDKLRGLTCPRDKAPSHGKVAALTRDKLAVSHGTLAALTRGDQATPTHGDLAAPTRVDLAVSQSKLAVSHCEVRLDCCELVSELHSCVLRDKV